ncbi:MAG TPA: peptidoglycan recognition family protein [Ktedonobacteraceae bacterium]|nr:peptidoglycan recognition family protein [Ktedonobacteraceae bacterium]
MHEPGALWLPNNNYFPARNGYTSRYVILHGTAGFTSAEEVANFFKATEAGNDPVSTHYIIGLNGELVQCIDEEHGAFANGGVTEGHDPWWSRSLNPNYITISIEHVKPARDNSDELTELQKQASFELVRRICERHNIPKRRADSVGGITGHYSMDPVQRSFCPGPYPWDKLFAFLHYR